MSTRPALQPRLGRYQVETILSYIKTDRDASLAAARSARALGDDMTADQNVARAAGLDRAAEIVTDMWAAARIAVAAVAADRHALAARIAAAEAEGVEFDD